jgi:casein kinase II subunit alpha
MDLKVYCSLEHDWTSPVEHLFVACAGIWSRCLALSLWIGQVVKGARDVYVVAQKLHDHVWSARSVHLVVHHQYSEVPNHTYRNTAHKKVVLKCAPEIRQQREKEILQQFEGDTCIRQLVDHAKEPPCLILEHLHSDALKSSGQAAMSRQDVKFIARSTLSALASLHTKGIAHTGKMSRVHPAR